MKVKIYVMILNAKTASSGVFLFYLNIVKPTPDIQLGQFACWPLLHSHLHNFFSVFLSLPDFKMFVNRKMNVPLVAPK